MTDIALVWDEDSGGADIAFSGADLMGDDGLETDVIMSLFFDRRADVDDEIPAGDGDRRGWYGDAYNDDPTDLTGSRLWLLQRSAATDDVPVRAKTYIQEALQHFIDDGVASEIDVATSLVSSDPAAASPDELYFQIEMLDPSGGELATFKYLYNWQAQSFRKAA